MNLNCLPLLTGWALDKWLGDPSRLPHPVVAFGHWISFFEHRLNHGRHRRAKGTCLTLVSVCGVFLLTWAILAALGRLCAAWPAGGAYAYSFMTGIMVFYCLAGTTLIREVRQVFRAADRSLEEGRRQVSRIVGRDTARLSDKEVRTAALETLAENLSDGVIAPLFWLYLLGLPGMLAYKMINTLDSMIGYRTERYQDFGRTAARLDDAANYLPARLTALIMAVTAQLPHRGLKTSRGLKDELRFILRYGRCHASPNSGYPEAALAGILDCRFGGTHNYFGQSVAKPYIGYHDRPLRTEDMQLAVSVNQWTELLMVVGGVLLSFL